MENNLFGFSNKNAQGFDKLEDIFIIPPFSIINMMSKTFRKRVAYWKNKGIKSELGRKVNALGKNGFSLKNQKSTGKNLTNNPDISNTSIFNPLICELVYLWFCKKGGKIIDPFAGGSVRGIVASALGYKYTGIELRSEQVNSNNEQAKFILKDNYPNWINGNANKKIEEIKEKFDLLFTCPPYLNLEKYSDLEDDLSNMNDKDFYLSYSEIITKACLILNDSAIAAIVVGDVRDNKGYYKRFPDKTKDIFESNGMKLLNEIHFYSSGNAFLRVKQSMKYNKVVKVHQTILVFQKVPIGLKNRKSERKK